MSGLVDRITEVLREHRSKPKRITSPRNDRMLLNITACTGCGWITENLNAAAEDEHAAHVAAVVQAALGLTEEWGYQLDGEDPDEPDAWFPATDYLTSRPVTHHRFVSPWVGMENQ